MTLLELCETNGNISLMNVDVRDEDLRLQRVYRIGARAKEWMSDKKDRTFILTEPVHVQDKGAPRSEYGFVAKSVPKQLLDLPVWKWSTIREFGGGIPDGVELYVDVISGSALPQIIEKPTEEDEDQYTLF